MTTLLPLVAKLTSQACIRYRSNIIDPSIWPMLIKRHERWSSYHTPLLKRRDRTWKVTTWRMLPHFYCDTLRMSQKSDLPTVASIIFLFNLVPALLAFLAVAHEIFEVILAWLWFAGCLIYSTVGMPGLWSKPKRRKSSSTHPQESFNLPWYSINAQHLSLINKTTSQFSPRYNLAQKLQ